MVQDTTKPEVQLNLLGYTHKFDVKMHELIRGLELSDSPQMIEGLRGAIKTSPGVMGKYNYILRCRKLE